MRTTTNATKAAWASGNYTGTSRPMVRATIQRLRLLVLGYGKQQYSSVPYGQANVPLELPNLKEVKWKRSVDGGVATMDLTCYNTEPLPLGEPPANGDFDQPGYYSPLRGNTAHSDRWDRDPNGWQDWIVPDRIIRTYEGYGFDATVAPEVDPNLYQSGVWRIDDVVFTHDGLINIACRDIGSVLLDQILFPPIVPFSCYPAWFETRHPVANPPVTVSAGGWVQPTYETSSNKPYVGNSGSVHGHIGPDAFDTSNSTYWLSIGNSAPDAGYSFEFVQGKFRSATVAGGQVRVWGGPYTCYVSVFAGGKWHGDQVVPYDPHDPVSAPNGSNIRYLTHFHVDSEETVAFALPKPIAGATKVRVTFTNLCNSGIGPYKYRAGVRSLKVSGSVSHTVPGGTHLEPRLSPPGISDYTDIVKIFLAWAGFYWPRETTTAFKTYSNGARIVTVAPTNDPALIKGRVWGDFEQTGTSPLVALPVSTFDKLPVADGIKKVADIVGFLFFIDDTGGAVFRSPNIWKVGNWIGDGGPHAGRTTTVVEIDETTTLMSLAATMSSRSIREKIFVANISGKIAAMANGHNPYPSGLRRVGGWCVDTETEIFTRRGWLRYDEVTEGDETLSIDMATGKSAWQAIREVAVFAPEPREMIELSANNFSALTTADHRWPVERYSTKDKVWSLMETTTSQLTSMDRIIRAAPRSDVPVEATIDDAMVELVAWTYTEGSVQRLRRCPKWRQVAIYQSQVVNERYCERIRSALSKAFPGGGWTERDRGARGFVWTLHAGPSREVVQHLGESKVPTMEFLSSLTQEQLELFINVSIMGDGWERLTSEFSKVPTRQFSQNVGPRLDAFLSACALAGVATSHHVRPGGEPNHFGHHDHAAVTLLQGRYYPPAQTASHRETRTEAMTVWCPSLPEHHNWLARRDGSVYYTSNTDQHFLTVKECQIMADLITLRQLFTYRTDKVTIPGNPAIQIDDQVRIYERVSEEVYLHYVVGVSMSWSVETGKYTYDLDTHWLGDTAFSNWTFNPTNLSKEAQAYLKSIGKIP